MSQFPRTTRTRGRRRRPVVWVARWCAWYGRPLRVRQEPQDGRCGPQAGEGQDHDGRATTKLRVLLGRSCDAPAWGPVGAALGLLAAMAKPGGAP